MELVPDMLQEVLGKFTQDDFRAFERVRMCSQSLQITKQFMELRGKYVRINLHPKLSKLYQSKNKNIHNWEDHCHVLSDTKTIHFYYKSWCRHDFTYWDVDQYDIIDSVVKTAERIGCDWEENLDEKDRCDCLELHCYYLILRVKTI